MDFNSLYAGCKQDIRKSEPHNAEKPDVTEGAYGPEQTNAADAIATPAHQVRMSYYCQAHPKCCANPLYNTNIDWSWLVYNSCAQCIAVYAAMSDISTAATTDSIDTMSDSIASTANIITATTDIIDTIDTTTNNIDTMSDSITATTNNIDTMSDTIDAMSDNIDITTNNIDTMSDHSIAAAFDRIASRWNFWDTLDGIAAQQSSRIFTALYCLTHFQGALVEGSHVVLPMNVNPCGTGPYSADCNYVAHGRLEVGGTKAHAISTDLAIPIMRFVVLTQAAYGGVSGPIPTFDSKQAASNWGAATYRQIFWVVLPTLIHTSGPTFALLCATKYGGMHKAVLTFPNVGEALRYGKITYAAKRPRAYAIGMQEPPPPGSRPTLKLSPMRPPPIPFLSTKRWTTTEAKAVIITTIAGHHRNQGCHDYYRSGRVPAAVDHKELVIR